MTMMEWLPPRLLTGDLRHRKLLCQQFLIFEPKTVIALEMSGARALGRLDQSLFGGSACGVDKANLNQQLIPCQIQFCFGRRVVRMEGVERQSQRDLSGQSLASFHRIEIRYLRTFGLHSGRNRDLELSNQNSLIRRRYNVSQPRVGRAVSFN